MFGILLRVVIVISHRGVSTTLNSATFREVGVIGLEMNVNVRDMKNKGDGFGDQIKEYASYTSYLKTIYVLI